MQNHSNEDIYEKAVSILETYFDVEDGEEENLAPAVEGGEPAHHGGERLLLLLVQEALPVRLGQRRSLRRPRGVGLHRLVSLSLTGLCMPYPPQEPMPLARRRALARQPPQAVSTSACSSEGMPASAAVRRGFTSVRRRARCTSPSASLPCWPCPGG
jgi:hypothetical protein